uniref:Sec-independent protein translocase protein n=1 Tax=Sciadopitys verticillata TaxID=28979 RepID=A0A8H2SET1_SCIVE|nr:Sec-independent protein translocase protein [Sciadopitys verticillata]BDC46298.1 Sec-independent protein translocase protein [Sciadopitys verticillata]
MNFASKTPPGEARIRSVWILIGPSSTRFTRHWFPEESIFPSAKPHLTLPLDPYSVRTRLTEASSTCVTTSSVACSYFVFPSISYQIWCPSIPSCYEERRARYNQFFHPSGFCFFPFLFLTFSRVVPNVWHFPCFAGTTSTNLLMIKLQPKIFDYIMSTVRISFIPPIRSQVPVIVIRLPEPKGLSVKTSTRNRRSSMVSPLPTAAFFAPPDIWCQIVACSPIYPMMELTISVASIVRVRGIGSPIRT